MSLAPRRSGLGGLPVTAVATATALVVAVSLASTAFAFHGPPAIRRSARCCTFHSSTDESAVVLASSKDGDGGTFYDDFADFGNGDDDDGEDDGDDDDDDDDDEAVEVDEAALASFRSKMDNIFEEDDEDDDEDEDDSAGDYSYESEGIGKVEGLDSVDDLIKFATSPTSSGAETPTEWARPYDLSDDASNLKGGTVLIANPAMFCSDFDDPRPGAKAGASEEAGGGMLGGLLGAIGGASGDDGPSSPSPALLTKFGLTVPVPADLGPDRRADLLPVLVVLDRHPLKGCQAVLLNRRTGYLLGDLESQAASDSAGMSSAADTPKLGAFMIQPLWFGGTSAASGGTAKDGDEGVGGGSGGLGMLHMCPAVEGAKQLTDDGLFWGGDPGQAQDAMNDPSLDRPMTGFDFKFYVQCTRWLPMQLEKEIKNGTWFVAEASKELLFKSRDRLGSKRAKPLWTELMELMGEDYRGVRDELYSDSS